MSAGNFAAWNADSEPQLAGAGILPRYVPGGQEAAGDIWRHLEREDEPRLRGPKKPTTRGRGNIRHDR